MPNDTIPPFTHAAPIRPVKMFTSAQQDLDIFVETRGLSNCEQTGLALGPTLVSGCKPSGGIRRNSDLTIGRLSIVRPFHLPSQQSDQLRNLSDTISDRCHEARSLLQQADQEMSGNFIIQKTDSLFHIGHFHPQSLRRRQYVRI